MLEPGYLKLLEKLELTEVEISHQAELDINDFVGISDSYHGEIELPAHAVSDRRSETQDTAHMTEITREEFNAKLETIDTKMDARVESVSAKIESFMAIQMERDKRLEATIAQIAASQAETKSGIGSMKNTMIITAISTVLAIVFGIASFNTALTANMMSAFQLGKGDPSSASTSAAPAVPATGHPPAAGEPKK